MFLSVWKAMNDKTRYLLLLENILLIQRKKTIFNNIYDRKDRFCPDWLSFDITFINIELSILIIVSYSLHNENKT